MCFVTLATPFSVLFSASDPSFFSLPNHQRSNLHSTCMIHFDDGDECFFSFAGNFLGEIWELGFEIGNLKSEREMEIRHERSLILAEAKG